MLKNAFHGVHFRKTSSRKNRIHFLFL